MDVGVDINRNEFFAGEALREPVEVLEESVDIGVGMDIIRPFLLAAAAKESKQTLQLNRDLAHI